MAKFVDFSALQHLTDKIKALFATKTELAGKVDNAKVLTDVPAGAKFTDTTYSAATTSAAGLMSAADKTKLDGVATGAEVNVITGIKRNGLAVTPTAKVVDISVPVKVSDLTNDEGYQTAAQVNAAVVAAGHMSKQIVSALPSTGAENVIYLVPKTGAAGNIYDEYLWIGGAFESFGDTSTNVDLSGYLLKTDMVAITTAEIDAMFA